MNYNVTKSYLHAITDDVIEGKDYKDVRANVYSLDQIALNNSFTYNGTTQNNGAWTRDAGDQSYPAGFMESRAFCARGKASVTVTGSAVAIRVGIDGGYGKAYVLIDGVKPSLIPGLTTALDIVTCNAANSVPVSLGQEIRDIIVADGLTDGPHTVELYASDNGASAFFVLHRIKAFSYANKIVGVKGWVAPTADMAQSKKLTFKNIGVDTIVNATVAVDTGLVAPNGSAIGTVNIGNMLAGATYDLTVKPTLVGNETAGLKNYNLALQSFIKDAGGSTPISNNINAPYTSGALTHYGSWYEEPAGATFPESSWGSANKYSWIAFNNYGDTFSVRLWRDSGLSAIRVMKNGVSLNGCKITSGSPIVTVPSNAGLTVGMEIVMTGFVTVPTTITAINGTAITMSANSSATNANRQAAFGNFHSTITVSTGDSALMQKFATMPVTGLGATASNSIILRVVNTSGFLYTNINYTEAANYTQVNETLQVSYDLKQVPPFPVENVRIENGKVKFDTPNKATFDLNPVTPHDNRGASSVDVEYRFPTFICCYATGFLEKFKQYDIVITDPMALTRKQVKSLQDLGIKVLNYISFGEEDGEPANVWDTTSAKSPQVGNGQGPGGYASYYMSQGYNFGESSECANDNQRLLDTKSCALSNAHYLAGAGRCGTACTKDSRDGYITQQAGGQCAGGFTSANKWHRTATTACTNATCTGYAPTNTKCPQYEQADDSWGQDFSVGSNMPDANGIWGSYYINAVSRGAGSWKERLEQHYMPLVFGIGQPKTETATIASHSTSQGAVLGVRASFYPIDADEPITVSNTSTGYVYTINQHYTIEYKTGVITFTTDPEDTAVPQAIAGVGVSLAYTKMGLESDGVFMDTVDTVDVYNRADYKAGMAGIINDLKVAFPEKMFCANRGFSIYDQIVKSISYSMAESVFSDYNFDTGEYQLITDQDSIDWNNNIIENLKELRRNNVFDVVCLNYAPNDASGDAIRSAVFDKTLSLGWIPWLSEINLDVPLDNTAYQKSSGAIRTNSWRKIDAINI